MTRCTFCGQSYTGLKADHFGTCRAIGYAFDDKIDFCDLESGPKSRQAVMNAKSAKKRKQHRGRIPVFGKLSRNFKET